MQAGAHAIDGCNKYTPRDGLNSVIITVNEIGDLTIGVKKETLVSGDWSFFSDFNLYYLGDGEHYLALDEADGALPVINEDIIYDEVTVARTMKAGKWNTFVVPFDMEIPTGWEVKALTGSSRNGDNITLNFENAGAIEAGVPYTVLVEEAVEEIVVENVQVTTTQVGASTDDVKFVGVYEAGKIPVGAFFISNNIFYQAADNTNTINAFRGYFTVTEGTNARALTYRMDGDEEYDGTTAIDKIDDEAIVVGIYTIGGVRVQKAQNGVNIINGKKVMVK
jgi:hypothetical protein